MVTKKFLKKVATERIVETGKNVYYAYYATDCYNNYYIRVDRGSILADGRRVIETIARFDFNKGWTITKVI